MKQDAWKRNHLTAPWVWVPRCGPCEGGEAGSAPSRTQPVPAGSAAAPAPGTAEALSEAGGTSGKARLREGKSLPGNEEKQVRNNPVTPGRGGGERLGGQLEAGQGQPTPIKEIQQFLMKYCVSFFSQLVYLRTVKRRRRATISLCIYSEQQCISSSR